MRHHILAGPALAALLALPSFGAQGDLALGSPVFYGYTTFLANGNLTVEGTVFTQVPGGELPTNGALSILNVNGTQVAAFVNNDIFLKGKVFSNQSEFPHAISFSNKAGGVVGSIDNAGNLYLRGVVQNAVSCKQPVVEFSRWNDYRSVQLNNNCYNYANNDPTYTFAQPGRAKFAEVFDYTGAKVKAAALAEGMTWVGTAFPGNQYNCPNTGTLVFLAVDPRPVPNRDHHWYRLDRAAGKWTHKPGGSPATDRDGSGNLISNPLTANRGNPQFNYTEAVGFFCTCGGDANVR